MISEKALPALGPTGTGRLKDMCLWGDQHRILQVIINLVSNSLKFTPEGGKVEVRIKCLGQAEAVSDGSRNSIGSKHSLQQMSRNRHRNGSGSNSSQISKNPSSNGHKPQGTALLINPVRCEYGEEFVSEEGHLLTLRNRWISRLRPGCKFVRDRLLHHPLMLGH